MNALLQKPLIDLQFLVVGTGRCGTVYFAKLLTSLGIPCTHEILFTPDGFNEAARRIQEGDLSRKYVSKVDKEWLVSEPIAESSYMAVPFLDRRILSKSKIIHVIRNPLDVISSFVRDFDYFRIIPPTNVYEKFIFSHIDLMEQLDPISRAGHFYLEWNAMIENGCVGKEFLIHKIEDPIDKVLNFLNVREDRHIFIDKRSNTKRIKPHTLDYKDINNFEIRQRLIEFSSKHGYFLGRKKLKI